jgi:hypothetical protein
VRASISLSVCIHIIRKINEITYAFNFVDHLASVIYVFEDCLYSFATCCHVIEIFLGALFLLLVFVDASLNLVLGCDGSLNSLNVEDFSLDPVVNVEEGVLQVLAEGANLLFSCSNLSALVISENHLGFITLNVVGQVQLLILIEHLQENLVILDRLTFSIHIRCYVLLQGFHDRQDLTRKMLELLALTIELILLNGVVEMIFNLKSLPLSFHDFMRGELLNLAQRLVDISIGPRKSNKLLRVDQEWERCHFL